MIDWFGNPIEKIEAKKPESSNPNPCIALYGVGLEGEQCKNCAQIVGVCKATTHYKCRLRKNTNGAATDHKLRWSACAKFEQRTGDIPLYDGRS